MIFYPVSTYSIRPNHYGRHDFDFSYRLAKDAKQFMRNVPYKPGDVVWISFDGETVQRAMVARFWRESDSEKFRVHVENRRGDAFCQNWRYAWPGEIERGYALALAAADSKKCSLAA